MQISGPVVLIKKSIRLFFERRNLLYFLRVYSPLIPFAVISAFQDYFIKSNYPPAYWVSALSLLVTVAYIAVLLLVGLAGIYAIEDVVSGGITSVRAIYGFAWKNFWRFSLLAVLLFFIIAGGLILLVIPAVIFGVWYSFSRFIFVEKNAGIRESLSGSKILVQGRFRQVFGRLFIFGLFAVLVQMAFDFVPLGIGSLITTLAGALFVLPSYLLYKELTG